MELKSNAHGGRSASRTVTLKRLIDAEKHWFAVVLKCDDAEVMEDFMNLLKSTRISYRQSDQRKNKYYILARPEDMEEFLRRDYVTCQDCRNGKFVILK